MYNQFHMSFVGSGVSLCSARNFCVIIACVYEAKISIIYFK